MTDEMMQNEKRETAPDAKAKKPPEFFVPRVPDSTPNVVIESYGSDDPHDRWFHKI